ncbi:uncharacterized protein si:ch211-243a20.3 [Nerophis ophidion]|uniref:uncharacterized protein si:ch211-243a20.3 n=1 Tax=Nerophis ophidion TaxID=159077 RepID=UPI002AE0A802|nr:uncharacterized protein si:ch211-243a20.3 [Nerophis ophidion]XP_061761958.1 uncharacterized protein si:ch211-243a20.3 [Nerophis ophidion]
MNAHWLLTVVAVATEARLDDDGHWNYREGVDRVDVTSQRSVTQLLDVWGKEMFKEIKSLLRSQPNTLLPDYSRVRLLSETIHDLLREVSLLRQRISELSRRLATLQPFLRRHGYCEAWDGLAPARRSPSGDAQEQGR